MMAGSTTTFMFKTYHCFKKESVLMLLIKTKRIIRKIKVGTKGFKAAATEREGYWEYPVMYSVIHSDKTEPTPNGHFGEDLQLSAIPNALELLVKLDDSMRAKYNGKGVIYALSYGTDLIARQSSDSENRIKQGSVADSFDLLDADDQILLIQQAKFRGLKAMELFKQFRGQTNHDTVQAWIDAEIDVA